MPEKKLVRVNVRANAGKPKLEVRNGREVLVVPSATMPDNVVMNGIFYPAEEIAKSYASLNRTPAPFGHPVIDGEYVSAKDPEAMNIFGVGAWNTNVRQENGRVRLDKVIDIEIAKASAKGKALLAAIEEGKPIHTSTGLLANMEMAPDGLEYVMIARDIVFDHDAILANGQEGAATPEKGVGMMVNNKKIEVVNSIIEEAEDQSLIERIVSAITNTLRGSKKEKEGMDEKKFEELSQKVVAFEGKLDGLGDIVANAVKTAVKPLQDNLDAIKANQEAKDKEELDGLVAKIVKANLMSEGSAKELTLNAARELAKKAEPGKAAALNAAFDGGDGSEKSWRKAPKAEVK